MTRQALDCLSAHGHPTTYSQISQREALRRRSMMVPDTVVTTSSHASPPDDPPVSSRGRRKRTARDGVCHDGSAADFSAQMPASSRPTRRRIFVPKTSAMTGPTSQTINGHTPPPPNEPPVNRTARRKRTAHDSVRGDDMTGSATYSYLTDFPQMPGSSRPTQCRIYVPETSAMPDPTSQSLNRHKRLLEIDY